jgi:hypothetical protein
MCRRAWRASSSSHGPHIPPCSAQPCSSTRSGPWPRISTCRVMSRAAREHAASGSRASASSRRSTSAVSWAAENVMRRREVPAGTVGGRIAGTHRPCARSASLAATAGGTAQHDRLDRRGGIEQPQSQAAARGGNARRARAAGPAATARPASRAARPGSRQRPPAAAQSYRDRCAPSAAGSRRVRASRRRTRRTCRTPCRACTSGSARRRASSPAASSEPGRCRRARRVRGRRPRTATPRGRGRRRSCRSGATSPSMLNTPSVTTIVRPALPPREAGFERRRVRMRVAREAGAAREPGVEQ